jgi:alkyl hydroperoxide reductase subunit F
MIMDGNVFDTIVIGGGPAGAAAAVYAARKRLKSLMVTESFGGQSMVSAGIEN